jgi:type I restriction enzyme S subunit
MNAERLLGHYEQIADAPDAIARLRRFILDLAVRGKLVPQDANDEPASELLKRVAKEKARLDRKERTKREPRNHNGEAEPVELPRGWALARLAELVSILNGRAYKQNELLSAGTPVLRVGNLFTSDRWYYSTLLLEEDKYCDKGDLIFAWSASFGPFIWTGEKVIYHYHIWKLPLHSEADLNKLYLYNFLLQKTREIKEAGHGISMIHMTKEKMELIQVPLPPLAEQHRIVAKIDELMGLCDRLEAARAGRESMRDRLAAASLARLNVPDPKTFQADAQFAIKALPALTTRPDQLKAIRQSILNLAVRGRLVPQDPKEGTSSEVLSDLLIERQKSWELGRASKATKDYTPPEHEEGHFNLPKNWTWASALELCQRVESGSTPPAAEMFEGEGEIPFLKVYNLTLTGALDFSIKPTFISRATHEGRQSRSCINPNDVLMNIVGPPLGKVSIVPDKYKEWNTNQAVVLFRPSISLLPEYLSICLRSVSVLSWITDLAQKTVGQLNISVTKCRRLPIPFPPLLEQHRIVTKVEALMLLCDQIELNLNVTAANRRELLDALLAEALAPEDKNDIREASELTL